MTVARRSMGRAAEGHVARLLERRGWRILARNLRTRHGEIDLIALDGRVLVFVEVKARRTGSATGPERPELAVGPDKQHRLRRLAAAWLAESAPARAGDDLRFDVVGVSFDRDGMIAAIDHIANAF